MLDLRSAEVKAAVVDAVWVQCPVRSASDAEVDAWAERLADQVIDAIAAATKD
jgi:hypothetical protein